MFNFLNEPTLPLPSPSHTSILSLWQDITVFFLPYHAERVLVLTRFVCSEGEKTSATSDFTDMVYLQTLLVAMNTSCLVEALMGKVKLYEGYSLFCSPKGKGLILQRQHTGVRSPEDGEEHPVIRLKPKPTGHL